MNEIGKEVIVSIIASIVITGIGWYLWHNKYFMKELEKLEEKLNTNREKLSKEHITLSEEHKVLENGQKDIRSDVQRVYDKIPDNHYFDYIEDILKPFAKVNVEKMADIRDIQLMTNQLTTTYATVYEKQNEMNRQMSNYQYQVKELELALQEEKELNVSLQEELNLKEEQIKNYNIEIDTLKKEIDNLNNPKQTKGMKM